MYHRPISSNLWEDTIGRHSLSPTLCQKFVASALVQTRQVFPQVYMVHYMDDILIVCVKKKCSLSCTQSYAAGPRGPWISHCPKKVQRLPPFAYLGYQLHSQWFHPQRLQLHRDNIKTLNDFQKLLGDINWIKPFLHITTKQLKPLFDILKKMPILTLRINGPLRLKKLYSLLKKPYPTKKQHI